MAHPQRKHRDEADSFEKAVRKGAALNDIASSRPGSFGVDPHYVVWDEAFRKRAARQWRIMTVSVALGLVSASAYFFGLFAWPTIVVAIVAILMLLLDWTIDDAGLI